MTSERTAVQLRVSALLSVQSALVGEITAQMRRIAVDISEQRLHLIVWHDGQIDEEIVEDFDASVVTQVVADFCWPERGDPQVSYEFIRCDAPAKVQTRGVLVYGRNEYALSR